MFFATCSAAISKALLKALFEKLEESYATRILLKTMHHHMFIPIKGIWAILIYENESLKFRIYDFCNLINMIVAGIFATIMIKLIINDS